MKRAFKKAIVSTLASAAIAASLIGVTSTGAFATNEVPCDSPDYVKVTGHFSGAPEWSRCFANSGTANIGIPIGPNVWVDSIDTGNNSVQWYGDGRQQPDQPIPPYTHMYWPSGPVLASSITIM